MPTESTIPVLTQEKKQMAHNQSALDEYETEVVTAKELNVRLTTLSKWRKAGEAPPHTMIGQRIYYRRETVRDWLKSRQIDLELS